jgi:hypothetical protein
VRVPDAEVARPEWWELYCIPYHSKKKSPEQLLPNPTAAAFILPVVIYACAIFTFSFLITSNQTFIDKSMESVKANIKTKEQAEYFADHEEANRQILQNPGMRVFISTTMTFKCLVTLAGTLMIFWISVSLLSGQWKNSQEFWLISTSSLSILLLCSLTLFILHSLTLLFDGTISFVLFMKGADKSSFLYNFIAQLDLFNIWFIYLLSVRLAPIYNESRYVLFVFFISVFVMTFLIFFFLGINFILAC